MALSFELPRLECPDLSGAFANFTNSCGEFGKGVVNWLHTQKDEFSNAHRWSCGQLGIQTVNAQFQGSDTLSAASFPTSIADTNHKPLRSPVRIHSDQHLNDDKDEETPPPPSDFANELLYNRTDTNLGAALIAAHAPSWHLKGLFGFFHGLVWRFVFVETSITLFDHFISMFSHLFLPRLPEEIDYDIFYSESIMQSNPLQDHMDGWGNENKKRLALGSIGHLLSIPFWILTGGLRFVGINLEALQFFNWTLAHIANFWWPEVPEQLIGKSPRLEANPRPLHITPGIFGFFISGLTYLLAVGISIVGLSPRTWVQMKNTWAYLTGEITEENGAEIKVILNVTSPFNWIPSGILGMLFTGLGIVSAAICNFLGLTVPTFKAIGDDFSELFESLFGKNEFNQRRMLMPLSNIFAIKFTLSRVLSIVLTNLLNIICLIVLGLSAEGFAAARNSIDFFCGLLFQSRVFDLKFDPTISLFTFRNWLKGSTLGISVGVLSAVVSLVFGLVGITQAGFEIAKYNFLENRGNVFWDCFNDNPKITLLKNEESLLNKIAYLARGGALGLLSFVLFKSLAIVWGGIVGLSSPAVHLIIQAGYFFCRYLFGSNLQSSDDRHITNSVYYRYRYAGGIGHGFAALIVALTIGIGFLYNDKVGQLIHYIFGAYADDNKNWQAYAKMDIRHLHGIVPLMAIWIGLAAFYSFVIVVNLVHHLLLRWPARLWRVFFPLEKSDTITLLEKFKNYFLTHSELCKGELSVDLSLKGLVEGYYAQTNSFWRALKEDVYRILAGTPRQERIIDVLIDFQKYLEKRNQADENSSIELANLTGSQIHQALRCIDDFIQDNSAGLPTVTASDAKEEESAIQKETAGSEKRLSSADSSESPLISALRAFLNSPDNALLAEKVQDKRYAQEVRTLFGHALSLFAQNGPGQESQSTSTACDRVGSQDHQVINCAPL